MTENAAPYAVTAPPTPDSGESGSNALIDAITEKVGQALSWLWERRPETQEGWYVVLGVLAALVGVCAGMGSAARKEAGKKDRGGLNGFADDVGEGIALLLGKSFRLLGRFVAGRVLWGEQKSDATFWRAGTRTPVSETAVPLAQLGSVAAAPAGYGFGKAAVGPSPLGLWFGRVTVAVFGWIDRWEDRGWRGVRALDLASNTVVTVVTFAGRCWRLACTLGRGAVLAVESVIPVVKGVTRFVASYPRWAHVGVATLRLATVAVVAGWTLQPASRGWILLAVVCSPLLVVLGAVTGPNGFRLWKGYQPTFSDQYAPHLWAALAPALKLGEEEAMQSWIALPHDPDAEGAGIKVRLPAALLGTERDRQALNDLVHAVIPGQWVAHWQTRGRDRFVRFFKDTSGPGADAEYGPVLWQAMAPQIGIPAWEIRRDWLTVAATLDETAAIRLRLPAHILGTDRERAALHEIVAAVVPGVWVARTEQHLAERHLTWTQEHPAPDTDWWATPATAPAPAPAAHPPMPAYAPTVPAQAPAPTTVAPVRVQTGVQRLLARLEAERATPAGGTPTAMHHTPAGGDPTATRHAGPPSAPGSLLARLGLPQPATPAPAPAWHGATPRTPDPSGPAPSGPAPSGSGSAPSGSGPAPSGSGSAPSGSGSAPVLPVVRNDDALHGPGLWSALRTLLRVPDYEPRSNWLRMPADLTASDAVILLRLPNGWLGEPEQIAYVLKQRVPGEWVTHADLTGGNNVIKFTRKPAPKPRPKLPVKVEWWASDNPYKIYLGEVIEGDVVKRQFVETESDTPHWGVAGDTGSGKSTVLYIPLVHGRQHGWLVDVLDTKKNSMKHAENRSGVRIHKTTRECMAAMAEFMTSMMAAEDAMGVDGDPKLRDALVPRLLVIDELPTLIRFAYTWWKHGIAQKGAPPFIDWLTIILMMGRSSNHRVVVGTQQFDNALFGGTIGRKQIGTKIVVGKQDMTSWGVAFGQNAPRFGYDTKIKGRGAFADNESDPNGNDYAYVREFQPAYITPDVPDLLAACADAPAWFDQGGMAPWITPAAIAQAQEEAAALEFLPGGLFAPTARRSRPSVPSQVARGVEGSNTWSEQGTDVEGTTEGTEQGTDGQAFAEDDALPPTFSLKEAAKGSTHRQGGFLPWGYETAKKYVQRSAARDVEVPEGITDGHTTYYTRAELEGWVIAWKAAAKR